jgi:hypothetical protein
LPGLRAGFPFRHGPAIAGDAGFRVSPRTDIGVDLFWMQWRNDSGRIRATAIDAVAQFRPWTSKGFFVKGGAGMAFVRNWVHTMGPHPDDSKALAVVFGGGWEFNPKGRLGLQLFATPARRRARRSADSQRRDCRRHRELLVAGSRDRDPLTPYVVRIATIGSTDAARRAEVRLARTATSTANAAPTTYARVPRCSAGCPCLRP